MVVTPRVEIFCKSAQKMASLCSLELLPSHLQRAQLHTGVVLGRSRAGRGWEGSGVSAADFRAQQLGAGSRSPRRSGLQSSPRGPSEMWAQVRARLQHAARSTQHAGEPQALS